MAWLGGPVIGIVNGVARDTTYGTRIGEQAAHEQGQPVLAESCPPPSGAAHQLSTATGVAAFAAYFLLLQRRWPIRREREAARIGRVWLALTVLFEFGFGRLVAKKSWQELLGDYNLAAGRTWPLLLAWLAVGPAVVRRSRPERTDLAGRGGSAIRHETVPDYSDSRVPEAADILLGPPAETDE